MELRRAFIRMKSIFRKAIFYDRLILDFSLLKEKLIE